jgi:hypothetical protein
MLRTRLLFSMVHVIACIGVLCSNRVRSCNTPRVLVLWVRLYDWVHCLQKKGAGFFLINYVNEDDFIEGRINLDFISHKMSRG